MHKPNIEPFEYFSPQETPTTSVDKVEGGKKIRVISKTSHDNREFLKVENPHGMRRVKEQDQSEGALSEKRKKITHLIILHSWGLSLPTPAIIPALKQLLTFLLNRTFFQTLSFPPLILQTELPLRLGFCFFIPFCYCLRSRPLYSFLILQLVQWISSTGSSSFSSLNTNAHSH